MLRLHCRSARGWACCAAGSQGRLTFCALCALSLSVWLGLLHRISKVLTRYGLSIHVARISTEKGAAIDTFYVRTALGKKPSDEALLLQIQSDLKTELNEQKKDMY